MDRLMELVEQALAQDRCHRYNILSRQVQIRLALNGHNDQGEGSDTRVLAEQFYAAALTTLALGARLVNALHDNKHISTEYVQ